MEKPNIINIRSSENGFLEIRNREGGLIQIPTFMYGDKPCWIASDVLKKLGYLNVNALINQCIQKQNFEDGVDHKVVKHSKLKELKELVNDYEKEYNIEEPIIDKKAPSLVVFFESGIIGFLMSSRTKFAKECNAWVRQEVVPSILKYGMYIVPPLLEDKRLLVDNLNKLIEDKDKEIQQKRKELLEQKEKYEGELTEEREKYQKKADSFKFIIMLKEDAEQTLEKERKKVRKLKKKIREIGPQTDEYGNKLTDYEKEVVSDIFEM